MIEEGLSIKEWSENIKKNSTFYYFYDFKKSVEKLKEIYIFDYSIDIRKLSKNKIDKFIVSLNNFGEYLKILEKILSRKKSPPDNILEEYINLSKKKVKLILERKFYKSLYNLIQKNFEEIKGEILKTLFQGIENKYSPEKCQISL